MTVETGSRFEVSKEGEPTGVSVELLPEDVIVVSGLKPEWPPWVRLEPHSSRILVSFDGTQWEDMSEHKELWILATLDPRRSVAIMQMNADVKRMLHPREPTESQTLRRVEGKISLSSFYTLWGAKLTLLRAEAKRDEVADAMLAEGDRNFYIEIDVTGDKIVQVNQRFVLSDELITLRLME